MSDIVSRKNPDSGTSAKKPMRVAALEFSSELLAKSLRLPSKVWVTGASWDSIQQILTVRIEGPDLPVPDLLDGQHPMFIELPIKTTVSDDEIRLKSLADAARIIKDAMWPPVLPLDAFRIMQNALMYILNQQDLALSAAIIAQREKAIKAAIAHRWEKSQ